MKQRLLYIPILFLFLLSFVDCAKKGSPSGGKRDSIPPVIVKSNPENYTINFTGNEIRIYFDEYIKLKDLQKELIISPPFKNSPIITPLSASKVLKIKILDTLKENTTYSFNFGKSIVDNNEGNAFNNFKYVFSTGSYIDSLKLSGFVTDVLLPKPENPTYILLYEVNEAFKDSLIFSEKPTYIAPTRDSISAFELTNLKEGNYLLLALKENNNDYTFQPINDKIGFVDSVISLPSDSTYVLTLFKEDPPYRIGRPKQQSKNHITFGFEGDADSLSIDLISPVPDDYTSKIFNDPKTDTIHYWFKPAVETDSLLFVAKKYEKLDTLTVRIRDLYNDTLQFTAIKSGILTTKDTVKISANTPLISVVPEFLKVINKDSVVIDASINLNSKFNIAEIIFDKEEAQIYTVELLPGAFIDFFEESNDTLAYRVVTKPTSDYGTISLALSNVNQLPIIVQLVDKNFEVQSEINLSENNPVLFDYVPPGNYYLRMVFDKNKNGKWDSGNFLQRLAPEKITYYPSKIEVRANWSLNETFTLD